MGYARSDTEQPGRCWAFFQELSAARGSEERTASTAPTCWSMTSLGTTSPCRKNPISGPTCGLSRLGCVARRDKERLSHIVSNYLRQTPDPACCSPQGRTIPYGRRRVPGYRPLDASRRWPLALPSRSLLRNTRPDRRLPRVRCVVAATAETHRLIARARALTGADHAR